MILLKNAKLYGEESKDLLLAGGQIVQIADRLDTGNLDLESYDLAGATLIPALVDQHVHVTGGGGEGGMTTRCPELEVTDILEAGVGTLVGLLGTDGSSRSIENLLAKTRALREYGFNAYCLTGAYEVPSPSFSGSVLKDITFIDECIGVKLAISDHRCSHPSKAEILRIGSQARLAGLLGNKGGVVHLHVGSGKQGIGQIFDLIETEDIPAFVFRPTHMNRRLDQAVRLTKLGSYADFTTGPNSREIAQTIVQALDQGEPDYITMSSDANGSMPKWNDRREMVGITVGKMSSLYGVVQSLVKDFGLSLREALKPCTVNVAKALKLYPQVGDILVGSRADLLVLDSNLEIKDFILQGNFVVRAGQRKLKINFVD